jgi:Xaa-Pro aminopeptidase
MNLRADRLTDLLPDAGVDVLLVTDLVNVRYLTGYSGSNGIALVGSDTRTFVTDFRYVEQAAEEVDDSFDRVRAVQDLLEALPDLVPSGGLRLGFDDTNVTVRQHLRMRRALPDQVELTAAGGLVERLRAIKDDSEVQQIHAASQIADAAFEQLLSQGLIGRTEREIAIGLEFAMRERGAEHTSFDPIVAAGPHGALPHAKPRDVEIKRGDMVVIDWGARLGGYCSDCTRTVAAGDPDEEARDAYALVLEAQLAGLGAVKAGVHGREADEIARSVITAGGHGDHFGHGLGHGVGLDIHEGPRLSQRSEDDLAPGNVVTVEPGVYLPGKFGIRIEDLVVVTDNGAQILTSLPKELVVSS